MSFQKLKVRPLVYAAGALFVGTKTAIDKSGEFREWRQLQQAPAQTSATVLSNQTLMSSSGKVIGYELSYEFTAPRELSGNSSSSTSSSSSNQSSGSEQSAAEVQTLLDEQFWGSGEGNAKSKTENESVSEIPAAEAPTPATEPIKTPSGEVFFRGEQLVKGEDYQNLNTNRPIEIVYEQSNPDNSAIVGTSAAPSVAPFLIGLAAFGLGFWFLWKGVKGYFQTMSPGF